MTKYVNLLTLRSGDPERGLRALVEFVNGAGDADDDGEYDPLVLSRVYSPLSPIEGDALTAWRKEEWGVADEPIASSRWADQDDPPTWVRYRFITEAGHPVGWVTYASALYPELEIGLASLGEDDAHVVLFQGGFVTTEERLDKEGRDERAWTADVTGLFAAHDAMTLLTGPTDRPSP